MSEINEVDVWRNEVPVVLLGVDGEFDVWRNEVPVEDVAFSETVTTIRRRAFEF